MAQAEHYAIRGGLQGRERMRIISRTLYPTTTALLERVGVGAGHSCLDVGCGGGDVTVELARRVGPGGRAVGVDIDETKLSLARQEAAAHGLGNVEFRAVDIRIEDAGSGFHVVYARFLLTHLSDPGLTAAAFFKHLRPGGLAVVEDIDFSGHFTWPESAAFERYRELYYAVVRKRGGDPNIGGRLPLLLRDAGFERIEMNVVQPIGTVGEVKLVTPITMENIADSILQDGLASREEINAIVRELRAFAADPGTVGGLPRIVQAWGRRPG